MMNRSTIMHKDHIRMSHPPLILMDGDSFDTMEMHPEEVEDSQENIKEAHLEVPNMLTTT